MDPTLKCLRREHGFNRAGLQILEMSPVEGRLRPPTGRWQLAAAMCLRPLSRACGVGPDS